jgi:hypothetical protein
MTREEIIAKAIGDDVRDANEGAIASMRAASEGMDYINHKLAHDLAGIPDRQGNERDQMSVATRAIAEGSTQ